MCFVYLAKTMSSLNTLLNFVITIYRTYIGWVGIISSQVLGHLKSS